MTRRIEKTRWKSSVPIRDRDSLRFIRDGTAVRFPSMNISWTCPTGESKSVSGKGGGGKCRVSLSTQNESTTSTRIDRRHRRIRPGHIFDVFGNPFCLCRCQSVQCAASWLVAAREQILQGLASGCQADPAGSPIGDSKCGPFCLLWQCHFCVPVRLPSPRATNFFPPCRHRRPVWGTPPPRARFVLRASSMRFGRLVLSCPS